MSDKNGAVSKKVTKTSATSGFSAANSWFCSLRPLVFLAVLIFLISWVTKRLLVEEGDGFDRRFSATPPTIDAELIAPIGSSDYVSQTIRKYVPSDKVCMYHPTDVRYSSQIIYLKAATWWTDENAGLRLFVLKDPKDLEDKGRIILQMNSGNVQYYLLSERYNRIKKTINQKGWMVWELPEQNY